MQPDHQLSYFPASRWQQYPSPAGEQTIREAWLQQNFHLGVQ
jgi:hypothetical protein